MASRTSATVLKEFQGYRTVYGEGFLSVLEHLVDNHEMRIEPQHDGTCLVRGLSVETGLAVEKNFESAEANMLSQLLFDGYLKPFRSSSMGNTFDLQAGTKANARKFLE
ncbi:MAG: hypothetical protein V1717_00700 [Candidatus Micrarchaeota archaeon]